MTVVGVVVVMTVLLLIALQQRMVRVAAAVFCVLYGFLLGATPVAEPLGDAIDSAGAWLWVELRQL